MSTESIWISRRVSGRQYDIVTKPSFSNEIKCLNKWSDYCLLKKLCSYMASSAEMKRSIEDVSFLGYAMLTGIGISKVISNSHLKHQEVFTS